MKEDLREYSDNELSLLVFNDEALYLRRKSRNFIEELKEIFIFTNEQLEILKNDLAEEEDENLI